MNFQYSFTFPSELWPYNVQRMKLKLLFLTGLCIVGLVEAPSLSKPDPPRDMEFVNATHNSVTVRWNAGFDGGLTQTFRVRYKVADMSAGYTYVDVQPPDANIFTVKGLSLGTDYELTVMAHNKLGGSDYAAVPVIAKTSNKSEMILEIEKPSLYRLGEEVKLKITWNCSSAKLEVLFGNKQVVFCSENDDGCVCSLVLKELKTKYVLSADDFTINNLSSKDLGTYKICLSKTTPCEIFEEVLVNINVNQCLQQPCQNEGTCMNTEGSYTCQCAPGWTGPNCTLDINECDEVRCENGGSCINTPGSYKCQCTPGSTGVSTDETEIMKDGEKKSEESQNSGCLKTATTIITTLIALAILSLIYMGVCLWRRKERRRANESLTQQNESFQCKIRTLTMELEAFKKDAEKRGRILPVSQRVEPFHGPETVPAFQNEKEIDLGMSIEETDRTNEGSPLLQSDSAVSIRRGVAGISGPNLEVEVNVTHS